MSIVKAETTMIKTEIEEESGEEGAEYQQFNLNRVTLVNPSIAKTRLVVPSKNNKVRLSMPHASVASIRPAIQTSQQCIKLGQSYSAFHEVSQAIGRYECQNKVQLTPKYFRRIAANPKPSNREDYMLSKEERKRFVYRWVDFCCTYFDSAMLSSEEGGDGPPAAESIGFTIKECPMRIRFQLRFKEKDLTVSIFRETHDHDHDLQTFPEPKKFPPQANSSTDEQETHLQNAINLAASSTQSTSIETHRPPPSLAPISSFTSCNDNNKRAAVVTTSTLSIKRPFSLITSPSLPKPPPLKKGPPQLISHLHDASGKDACLPRLHPSAEAIVFNIYNYLFRARGKQSGSVRNEIVFTANNPNLIKLTSDVSGIEEEMVHQIIEKKVKKSPVVNINKVKVVSSLPQRTQLLYHRNAKRKNLPDDPTEVISSALPIQMKSNNLPNPLTIQKRFSKHQSHVTSQHQMSKSVPVPISKQFLCNPPITKILIKSEPVEEYFSNEDEFEN